MKSTSNLKYNVIFFLLIFILSFYVFGQDSITYQGTVTTSGGTAPPNNNYGMRFGLWNLESGGAPGTNRLWQESHINADAVAVTNGAFSVELGSITVFPANFFTNNLILWLEVEVNLSGIDDSALEIYTPRVRFSKTPYSFYSNNSSFLGKIAPGSFLRSDVNDNCTGRIIFNGVPTGPSPDDAGVWINPVGSNPNDVVFSMTTSGLDMIIMSDPGNLTVSGVIQGGTISFPVAYSRLGDGTPVIGKINASNDLLINGSLEVKDGIYLIASSVIQGGTIYTSADYNRLGDGVATNANIDASNDLLVNGSLEVKNGIYWSVKSDYIGYSPSNFTSQYQSYKYENSSELFKDVGYLFEENWWAPVNLPTGAVITEFRVWYRDNDASSNLGITLNRRAYGATGSSTEMSYILTSGTPGESNITDSTINYATINNNSYTYHIKITFPSADTFHDLSFRQAKITYTTSGM